ncbi:hypothetical protein BKA62DRAFT_415822 [Auriculariales sp. MPI-PUGE-AT-0066]|nr:hypothetical protein BKA62DRAFT_415822 [Auriculariales sp. MPI-PUGE-AT-0066]
MLLRVVCRLLPFFAAAAIVGQKRKASGEGERSGYLNVVAHREFCSRNPSFFKTSQGSNGQRQSSSNLRNGPTRPPAAAMKPFKKSLSSDSAPSVARHL